MRLLLDSHTLILFFIGDRRFSEKIRIIIEDDSNEKVISTASVWEVSIKQSIGKLTSIYYFSCLINIMLVST